jgi:dTDP-4-amino-4,6-dideoxygalactose transaminase
MFGIPCDMDAIREAAGPTPVIEDCALSLFSAYKGRQTGFASTASFFSFRCGKYLSAGGGSAIFCKDPDLHARIERVVETFEAPSMPANGADALMTVAKAALYSRPWYGLVGRPLGTKLDGPLNLTAKEGFAAQRIAPTHLALIEERIGGFEKKVQVQREHAELLLSLLEPGCFDVPTGVSPTAGCPNWQHFPLIFETQQQRDAIAEHLYSRGIDSSRYLNGVVDEARQHYGYEGDCPNAERLSETVLLVPIHYTLSSDDIRYIARAINEGARAL